MNERLASERTVIQSPLSYTGSGRRIWRITWTDNPWLRWLLLIPLALIAVTLAWAVVTVWYVLFGLLVVPWRLVRRGSRKRKRDELRHRELLEQRGR